MSKRPGFKDLFAGEVVAPESYEGQAAQYLEVAESWDRHHSPDAYRQLAIFYAIMHLSELIEKGGNYNAGN